MQGPTDGASQVARTRLMDSMAAVIYEKGYAATTVADVVAHARVSRRTFYEHFKDKRDCMIGSYSAVGKMLVATIPPIDPATFRDAHELLHTGVENFLHVLATHPSVAYSQFVAVHEAGLTTSPQRLATQDAIARELLSLTDRAAQFDANVHVPSHLIAIALVGSIDVLIVRTIAMGQMRRLPEMAPTLVELIGAVVLNKNPDPHGSE
ncbi:MAG: TetR/AcrR family transcriptional regulator [Nocardiaceae bacterium]|nr:TetR/AcrR family transcriptional regulator [Nocardiaceae bacterium]